MITLRLPVGYADDDVRQLLGRKYRGYTLRRLSLDKRDVTDIRWVAQYERADAVDTCGVLNIPVIKTGRVSGNSRPVVAGAGPAGLFAALILAKAGAMPLILERGGTIEERTAKVRAFRYGTASAADTANTANTTFDSECNICYGEGGAGAFSDGKLNTGIKSDYLSFILRTFVKHGAPSEILYLAKPHIGTDKLCGVIRGLRDEITNCGGEFIFNARLTDIITKDNTVTAVQYKTHGVNITTETDTVILATGHSAKDIYRLLSQKLPPSPRFFAPKDFSAGVRVEHRRRDINEKLHGRFADTLPAADYKYSVRVNDNRGVYTFCMCPGGVVVNSSTSAGKICVNGMSDYARDAENSNSAVLVSVRAAEIGGADNAFAAVDFLSGIEKRAFEISNKTETGFAAPVQLLGDFINGGGANGNSAVPTGGVLPSYLPGVTWTDLRECLPEFVHTALKAAFLSKNFRSLYDENAVLTGVETRSSAPLRLCRDTDTLVFTGIRGVYPCGEGAGYAGGIMSSAADGLRVAEQLLTAKYAV